MEEKYLSIITNFGCHFRCPYCIVKNNKIDVPVTTVQGLFKLEEAVKAEQATIISVSGGGDPLHNYLFNSNYYTTLFSKANSMNIPVEIHTSYFAPSFFRKYKCHRVVYHLHNKLQLLNVKKYNDEITRVVYVVTPDMTKEHIDFIADFVKNSPDIDELSFRQMVDSNYQNTYYHYDYLKAGHKKDWYYIEQCDYNTYYVNGKIYYKFSEIGKEK